MKKILIVLIFALFFMGCEGDWRFKKGDIVMLQDSTEVVILQETYNGKSSPRNIYKVKNIKNGMLFFAPDEIILKKLK